MDILSDILRVQRLRGTVYFRASFREPWGLDIQGGQFANFHIIADGMCWLRHPHGPDLQLRSGDVAIFPHGTRHALLHSPEANPIPAAEVLANDASDSTDSGPIFGGSGAVTSTLICGHFECDRDNPHPLFETLPPLVHVSRSEDPNTDWLTTAGQLAAAESNSGIAGNQVVVDRLAEALLIQALISYVNQMEEPASRSFLAAIQDVSIGRTINAMHNDISRNWSLNELASLATMSRTAFANRFRELVGESPMTYLASWRMLKARELLLDTSMSLAEVSHTVGYDSEFSFGKAFKRMYGSPPGKMRSTA